MSSASLQCLAQDCPFMLSRTCQLKAVHPCSLEPASQLSILITNARHDHLTRRKDLVLLTVLESSVHGWFAPPTSAGSCGGV